MNTNNIKKYAPRARTQFRAAVMQKLTTLGIAADKKGNLLIADAEVMGNTVRFGQFDYPKSVLPRRDQLVNRALEQGFNVFVEHCAYTWFNRLCAIRYMEIQGYLDHGFRVLSHPDNSTGFEVLDHIPAVADSLAPDNKTRWVEMKLAGNQDESLYRELLLGQCHALHHAMPFLFEAVDDEAELLLPDNLTRTDSILRGLVDSIPEEDWQQVEIIGWLYQFYISEKKDEVIGKVVKSEDIPAATQLFTPNWIVQYLVQNSVGRQWLQTYPDSPLKSAMPYYIEPAEQTPEVQAQLAAIIPASIEPESIKVLDPACGSGHILIEAYNVLKHIYEERGYRSRDIPQLILENNIFGLDIDDRAAQLSGFAMLMMARQDDRRIFSREVRLNIVSLQESLHLDVAKLWQQLNFHQQSQTGSVNDMFGENALEAFNDSAEYQLLNRTLKLFVNAKTLGSLIQVPQEDEAELKAFLDALYRLGQEGDIQQKVATQVLIPYIQQAWILAQRYDAVVANPPYMGSKGMNSVIKEFAKQNYPESKSDLFGIFIERQIKLLKNYCFLSLMTPFVWMYLKSYQHIRERLLEEFSFHSLIQPEYHSFFESAFVPIVAFNIQKNHIEINGRYFDLRDSYGAESQPIAFKKGIIGEAANNKTIFQGDFKALPSCPIAISLSEEEIDVFRKSKRLSDISVAKQGLATGENNRFLRQWYEVSKSKISFGAQSLAESFESGKKWFPYNKGGQYKKWYGNRDYIVNWENDGKEIKNFGLEENGKPRSRAQSTSFYLKPSIGWSKITVGEFSVRYFDKGFIFDVAGCSVFSDNQEIRFLIMALLNSTFNRPFLKNLAQTINYEVGQIINYPIPEKYDEMAKEVSSDVKLALQISKDDWDSSELSWDFIKLQFIGNSFKKIEEDITAFQKKLLNSKNELKNLENRLNDISARYFNLPKQYTIQDKDITLLRNPSFIFNEEENEKLFLRQSSELNIELCSYSIGCMMGRYSLDREGLVYAHEGNQGFAELVAEGAYNTFPADADGILPLMDSDWFDDDISARVKEFVRTVWGEEHLLENLDFIAQSLVLYAIKPKKGESSLDAIRRYLSTQFWKDHLKMYKKRPIYWLFSSGKEKAFECLVYLHRYNEATLARMRTEYVVPLLARYQSNIDRLNDQIDGAGPGEATRLKRERDVLTRKFNELRSFDDQLRHYADRRISIDLDDGVKVNYGKFGDLLADVKAITGSTPEII